MRRDARDPRDDPRIPAAVATLTDQIEAALNTGCSPAVWTPQFAQGCQLLGVSLETHLLILRWLPVLAEGVQKLRGADVSRVLHRTSLAIYEALDFLGDHPGRRMRQMGGPPGTWRAERLHIAHVVLTFSPEEAARRVRHYAICSDAFDLAHREFRRREERIGGRDPAVATMALATGLVPQAHEVALDTLRRLSGVRPKGNRLSVDRVEDKEAEFYGVLGDLLAPHRQEPIEELLGKVLDGDPKLKFLPNSAKMDLRNWWAKGQVDVAEDFRRRLAEMECPHCHTPLHGAQVCPACHLAIGTEDRFEKRKRSMPEGAADEASSAEELKETLGSVFSPGGTDPSVWRPEKAAAARGRQTMADRFSDFLSDPPKDFLDGLTDSEERAFETLRQLWSTRQFDLERKDVLTQIAETAHLSLATVSRLMEKIRKFLPEFD